MLHDRKDHRERYQQDLEPVSQAQIHAGRDFRRDFSADTIPDLRTSADGPCVPRSVLHMWSVPVLQRLNAGKVDGKHEALR